MFFGVFFVFSIKYKNFYEISFGICSKFYISILFVLRFMILLKNKLSVLGLTVFTK